MQFLIRKRNKKLQRGNLTLPYILCRSMKENPLFYATMYVVEGLDKKWVLVKKNWILVFHQLSHGISWLKSWKWLQSWLKSWNCKAFDQASILLNIAIHDWINGRTKFPPSFIADLCERCSEFHWHPCVVSLPGSFSSAFSSENLVPIQRWIVPLIHVVHGVFSILHDIYSPQNSRITKRLSHPWYLCYCNSFLQILVVWKLVSSTFQT